MIKPFLFASALLILGCAQNPADNKPAAQVSQATATPQASPLAQAEGVAYAIQPETSKIGWTGSKVTGSHDGGFRDFRGTISVVEGSPEQSRVELEIVMDSLFSDDEKLTKHLKNADFFDVEKFPTSAFRSTGVSKKEDGFELSGDLTMHGVTKNIKFPAQIEVTAEAVEAKAEFSILRGDFGITYKGKADNLIRDEVVIRLELKAPKV